MICQEWLVEQLRKLKTFWTQARYRSLLPFGLSKAKEIYQIKLHQISFGLKGVISIAADLIEYCSSDTEKEAMKDHNKNLKELLECLRKKNVIE